MNQKPILSKEKTGKFLRGKFPEGITELTPLDGGDWSQAYSYIHKNKKYVLRWSYSSETFEKDDFAARFYSNEIPIPKIMESGAAFDTQYAISEFARGGFFDTLSGIELEATLPSLFNLFDSLRNADVSLTTGYGGWDKKGTGVFRSWKEYLLSVKNDDQEHYADGWYSELKNSHSGTGSFDRLYSKLQSLVEKCPEKRELIHSDLLNYNLLVADTQISAVIDWQCSLYGDALYDIAWFVFYAPWYPEFEKVKLCERALDHYKSQSLDEKNTEERLLCYQLHIGLGSIAYNVFKKDWQAVTEVTEHSLKIMDSSGI